jgi:hypothetical protein
MGNNRLRIQTIIFYLIFAMAVSLFGTWKAAAIEPVGLTAVGSHHVAGVNSGQPYVAGFHVLTDDFKTYRMIDGTAITAAFPSTNANSFPADSWLGAGMFLQAQDHKYLFVDYGFYMMIVLDSTGTMFIDIGLHETREGSLPIQQPDAQLVYSYTWQLSGVDPAVPITLFAQWDSEGFLHYSVRTAGGNFSLTSIKVSLLPDCDNIMPHFYTGNVIGQQFPLGRYVSFFQFGVISSKIIGENQWKVSLTEPRFLKEGKWENVEKAWSIQGDISYLDQDARWGGTPYLGVDAQYFMNPLLEPYELVFSYESRTLASGTVLWDMTGKESNGVTEPSFSESYQTYVTQLIDFSLFLLMFLVCGLSTRIQSNKP